MAMQAGKLDRRLTLERAVTTADAANEPIATWAVLATVWAHRMDLSDGERVRAAEVGAVMTTRFRIRWATAWADLDPRDRLQFEGRVYNIVGVKEIGRREGLEITAAARAEAP